LNASALSYFSQQIETGTTLATFRFALFVFLTALGFTIAASNCAYQSLLGFDLFIFLFLYLFFLLAHQAELNTSKLIIFI
jgi:hypothetical protein